MHVDAEVKGNEVFQMSTATAKREHFTFQKLSQLRKKY